MPTVREGTGPALGADVVEVVNRIVDEVAGKTVDREMGCVAANAGALPLIGSYIAK